MSRILIVAFALVGAIVGAAFATGRESLIFYTSFGLKGTGGLIIATLLYAYFSMILVYIGQRFRNKTPHKTLYALSGKPLGIVIDIVILLTMFSTGVAMIAGGGSILHQQFDLPFWQGSLLMAVITALTIMLNARKVVIAVGALTPFLLLFLIAICSYSLINNQTPLTELEPLVLKTKETLPGTLPNWLIAALNHVSFNMAVGAGMALVIGSCEKNPKHALLGGALGGLLIGGILLLGHFNLFTNIEAITASKAGKLIVADMPLLAITASFPPIVSWLMMLIIFGMIYNTSVSMFYVVSARFVPMETKQSKPFIVLLMAVALLLSSFGFTDVVGYLYPIMGYLGFILIGLLLYAPVKFRGKPI